MKVGLLIWDYRLGYVVRRISGDIRLERSHLQVLFFRALSISSRRGEASYWRAIIGGSSYLAYYFGHFLELPAILLVEDTGKSSELVMYYLSHRLRKELRGARITEAELSEFAPEPIKRLKELPLSLSIVLALSVPLWAKILHLVADNGSYGMLELEDNYDIVKLGASKTDVQEGAKALSILGFISELSGFGESVLIPHKIVRLILRNGGEEVIDDPETLSAFSQALLNPAVVRLLSRLRCAEETMISNDESKSLSVLTKLGVLDVRGRLALIKKIPSLVVENLLNGSRKEIAIESLLLEAG